MYNIIDKTPKYLQIIDYIMQQINKKELKDGDKLPTEEELCSYFNVSRITVRNALNELESEGYILKKHGKGSYINAGITVMQLNALKGFTEEMKARGMSVTSKLINFQLIDADNIIAKKLHVEEKSKIYNIVRLRYVDNEPMAIETVYIPYFMCPNLNKYDTNKSLYGILESVYNIYPVKADQCIEAGIANKKDHEFLNIKLRAPILKIERTSYLNNNVPLEYVTSIYRGDKYKFYVTLNK